MNAVVQRFILTPVAWFLLFGAGLSGMACSAATPPSPTILTAEDLKGTWSATSFTFVGSHTDEGQLIFTLDRVFGRTANGTYKCRYCQGRSEKCANQDFTGEDGWGKDKVISLTVMPDGHVVGAHDRGIWVGELQPNDVFWRTYSQVADAALGTVEDGNGAPAAGRLRVDRAK